MNPRAGKRVDVIDRLASHPRLRSARNWTLRQSWLRGAVRIGKKL